MSLVGIWFVKSMIADDFLKLLSVKYLSEHCSSEGIVWLMVGLVWYSRHCTLVCHSKRSMALYT